MSRPLQEPAPDKPEQKGVSRKAAKRAKKNLNPNFF